MIASSRSWVAGSLRKRILPWGLTDSSESLPTALICASRRVRSAASSEQASGGSGLMALSVVGWGPGLVFTLNPT